MSLIIKEGNLLDATEQYIVQQCNCVATKAHGLSEQISNKFPYADSYAKRRSLFGRNWAIDSDQAIPGTYEICGDGINQRFSINIYAQYGMGKPYAYGQNRVNDSNEERKKWFKRCLDGISSLNAKSIAFPYKIGCGLAGGDWNEYYQMLDEFAKNNVNTQVVLYQL